MKNRRIQSLAAAGALLALSGSPAFAQFSVLHSFTGGADGASPYYGSPVVAGSALYGTANMGGAEGGGVVFSVNTDGSNYRVLHTFTTNAPDGYAPLAAVTLNGTTLYGTTYGGGDSGGYNGDGTIFSVQTDGSGYQPLLNFDESSGFNPFGPVLLSGANLYGMTWTSDYWGGSGSIYSVGTNGGNYTTLHDFSGAATDGSSPVGGALTLIGATLYGLTANGGVSNNGVVFSINTDGSDYTNLVSFAGAPDGANPYGSLTLANGMLYGTTTYGGVSNLGTIFLVNPDGTGYSTLYSFTGGAGGGANPNGSLTLLGSVLVGTTASGGAANDGTVFKINLDGSGFAILHSFTGADGANPQGDLAVTTNDHLYTLYGWTPNGGANNSGTLFALTVGGYAFEGLGITNVLTGSVANGGLSWGTVPTWLNVPPPLPYTYDVAFALPSCQGIAASRLIMTLWGGTPDYTCQMTVSVNGTNLPAASPFAFGSTTNLSAVFDGDAPCAYGSGYGVWLVTLPVPGGMLHTDGSSNTVEVTETTPDNFDGRIQHVTLVAVYQSSALTNEFDYALAEGSGDIYGTPTPPEVNQRTVVFPVVNPANATAATLTALYTYGHAGLDDELFFNGTQLGGDDLGIWNGAANYGPGLASFGVLANLAATNTALFTVAADVVPPPLQPDLRPQFVALAVNRPVSAGQLAITGFGATGARLVWTGPSGGNYSIESTTCLSPAAWSVITNFTSASAVMTFTDTSATNGACRFYRAKTQ